ncbi:MAG: BrnT family toxin [Rhodocyclaceae bacterium]|nr:BrnT family toxin [Rhodocyclaceae bacterium]MDP1957119.1 BrnT family toxin [Rhodocyclaceae bacterium]
MKFGWDDTKANVNWKKHGVAFQEATTVFGDPLAGAFPDPDHSQVEERWLTVGMSAAGRLLVVAHAEYENMFRIISARVATPHERNRYEQQ